jgi:hypothetical protein
MQLLLDSHLLVWAMVIKQALGRPDFHVQPVLLRRAHHALAVAPCHRCNAIPLLACRWPTPARMACC